MPVVPVEGQRVQQFADTNSVFPAQERKPRYHLSGDQWVDDEIWQRIADLSADEQIIRLASNGLPLDEFPENGGRSATEQTKTFFASDNDKYPLSKIKELRYSSRIGRRMSGSAQGISTTRKLLIQLFTYALLISAALFKIEN